MIERIDNHKDVALEPEVSSLPEKHFSPDTFETTKSPLPPSFEGTGMVKEQIKQLEEELSSLGTVSHEIVFEQQKTKAIDILKSAYYDLHTQPTSIESQRYSQGWVEQGFYNLKKMIGEVEAIAAFQKIKDDFAPTFGYEPKIEYAGVFDKWADKMKTTIKDYLD